jgi:uncharacterized cofD-like protein
MTKHATRVKFVESSRRRRGRASEGLRMPRSISNPADPPEVARIFPELRVAAVGGGTGLPTVLRGLRALLSEWTGNRPGHFLPHQLVAIVTTTDDGGSSGKLRRDFGIIPPGDARNCLAALAEDESLLSALFQFRFDAGEGLCGHALGNLMLAALTDITGDFTQAVEFAGRVIGARGLVVPATSTPITLYADLADGRIVTGETAIVGARSGIRRLSLVPPTPRAVHVALDALQNADVIVIGPGSLYTSILPPLLVPEIFATLREAKATRVFVLNLMTEPGETDGFNARRHLDALREHLDVLPFDVVVFNDAAVPAPLRSWYADRGALPIAVTTRDLTALRELGLASLGAPLVCEGPMGRVRHHPGRLAAAIVACGRLDPQELVAIRQGQTDVRTLLQPS